MYFYILVILNKSFSKHLVRKQNALTFFLLLYIIKFKNKDSEGKFHDI